MVTPYHYALLIFRDDARFFAIAFIDYAIFWWFIRLIILIFYADIISFFHIFIALFSLPLAIIDAYIIAYSPFSNIDFSAILLITWLIFLHISLLIFLAYIIRHFDVYGIIYAYCA